MAEKKDLIETLGLNALTTEIAKEKFGDNGAEVFRQVARAGGFGNVTDKQFLGGASLDLKGLSGETREAVCAVLASVAK